MGAPGLPIQKIKDSMRATWMAGDFGVVAKTISAGAESFAGRLAVPSGAKVLDVACGTGNVAIPLARQGAVVTGVDIAPNLLVQARERAAAENLTAKFDEGDAEALPYADASFEIVVTMFGAMFAPRPDVVASELARVLKPGGLLAMANWNPASFTGKCSKSAAATSRLRQESHRLFSGAMRRRFASASVTISRISRRSSSRSTSSSLPTPPEQSPSFANFSARRRSPSAALTKPDRRLLPPILNLYGRPPT